MITGEITVNTCSGDAVIPVEIFDIGPRLGTVWVRALNGLAPFTRFTHGGPCQDHSAVWSIPGIRNIHIDFEELPKPQPIPVPEPPERAPDWFLEMAYEDRTCIEE